MVNLYRRTLKRPLQTDSYPDALENLRALDSFTHDEESKLRNTSVLLLAAIAKACPVNRPPRNMASNMPDSSSERPSVSNPTGVVRLMPAPPNMPMGEQRASKRQTVQRVGGGNIAGGTSTAHQDPPTPLANPSAPTPHFVHYGIPTSTGHGQYLYGHPGFESFASNGFGPPTHQAAHPPAALDPNSTQPGFGPPPASHQISASNISLPPGGPASEAASYPTNFHSHAYSQPGNTGSTSGSSSANISSHPYSLFDHVSASVHSHVDSSSNAGASSSQAWVIPDTTPNVVLSTWLQKFPLTLSRSALEREIRDNRYGLDWANWEREFLIVFWVGPQAPPHLWLVAMGAQKSPEPEDTISPEWLSLSRDWFGSSRNPATLVQQWWILVQTYCRIRASFSVIDQEPADAIIARIHLSLNNTTTLSTAQTSKVKAQDLAAWVERGRNSWFAMMDHRIRNHHQVTQSIKDLQTAPVGERSTTSRASSSRRGLPTRGRSRGGLPATATPPPPASTSGSVPQPGQPSQLSTESSFGLGDLASGRVTTFAPNLPGWLESLKGHNLATQTTVDLAQLKMSYIQVSADAMRVRIAQDVAAIETRELDLRRRAARDIINDPKSPPHLRESALATYASILNPRRTPMLSPDEFIKHLRLLIPDSPTAAESQIEDPYHPSNVIDFVESADFAAMIEASGLTAPSGVANPSDAAGPSHAADD